MAMDFMNIEKAISEASSNLARSITQELGRTDRQRINMRSSNILFHGLVPGGGAQLLYTVPEKTTTEITEYIITNNQGLLGTSLKYQLALVPVGVGFTANHIIFSEEILLGGKHQIITVNTALLAGWKIYIISTEPTTTVVHISGIEQVR